MKIGAQLYVWHVTALSKLVPNFTFDVIIDVTSPSKLGLNFSFDVMFDKMIVDMSKLGHNFVLDMMIW